MNQPPENSSPTQAHPATAADDLNRAHTELAPAADVEAIDWLSPKRAAFLSRFPLLLNSSQDARRVIGRAVELLRRELSAEAGTVFLLSPRSREVSFWAIGGTSAKELEGRKMPLGKGIVSWVIERGEPALVLNVSADHRFFKTVDDESRFVTRDLICVPLASRGGRVIGALEIINRLPGGTFGDDDLRFLEVCAPQVALAVENAMLYQQLEEGKRKVEQLEKKKGDAMTVIAHEFRTPLNLIQNSCELLAQDSVSSEVKSSLAETVARGVDRLSRLVSGVRDLAQLSSKSIEVSHRSFRLGDLLSQAEETIEQAKKTRKLGISVEKSAANLTVGGDPALLALALNNLISNAIRFTPDGGTIAVRLSRALDLVTVAVIDNGIGVPEDQQEAIFEKFYEVGSALHHSSGEYEFGSSGLGLGLTTAREIIRGHGSELELQSIAGKGSKFSFSLPVIAD
jgi:signal transduction histidine kinase